MEEHGINSATFIVHSVKSRDSITWSQDSTTCFMRVRSRVDAIDGNHNCLLDSHNTLRKKYIVLPVQLI